MESEDSDVCLTTSHGALSSPRKARANDLAHDITYTEHGAEALGDSAALPSQGTARHYLSDSPQHNGLETRHVQQHQSPRREFLLRQVHSEDTAPDDLGDVGAVVPRSCAYGERPDQAPTSPQPRVLSPNIQVEKDENQSTECNGGNSESHVELQATDLDHGKLHLPAFERLMQVMHRLDGPDAWNGGSVPPRKPERSPLRNPNPAESPLQLSRRHPLPHPDSVPPRNPDHGFGLVSGEPHSPACVLRTSAKSQPVSSHPIESFDESSPSQGSDACGPPPTMHGDGSAAAEMSRARRGYDQRDSSASSVHDKVHVPVQTQPRNDSASEDAGPSANSAAVPLLQYRILDNDDFIQPAPEAGHTRESPPAKARRRSPPALSSLSLVAPASQAATSPSGATALPSQLPGEARTQHQPEQVITQASSAQPCLQHADSDTSSLSQSQQERTVSESSRARTVRVEGVASTEVSPYNVSGKGVAAHSGGVGGLVHAEDSRVSSISQKEELLQFLGNLSNKFELDVDVTEVSPNGSTVSASHDHRDFSMRASLDGDTGQQWQPVASAIDWKALNKQLHANGFTPFATEAGNTKDMFLLSVRDSVSSILEEFERRGTLVQQLLGVADGSASERSKHLAELKSVQRDRDSLAVEVRKLKEALQKERSLQKDESTKKGSQIQGLENDIKKLQRQLEASKKASQRTGTLHQSLEIHKQALASDVEDLKKRCATTSDAAAKLQAENKRLQGYVKQLEATQRLKDAKLQELEEFKREGVRKLDSMERLTSAASKDAQGYEAQLQGLHRQLKEAQAAVRVFEQDSEKMQADLAKTTTVGQLAEERAATAEASLKEASTQQRVMATRVTALESQLRAKEVEVEDANAAAAAAREGRSETECRILQLQADLRGACADTAALTAQLGVQMALAHSREVEVEELKAAVQSASVREEVAEGTLGDTVSEVRRLKAECAKHQCLIKTQVAALRARESELDSVRASYTAAEARTDNLSERLKVSGMELRKAEEALRAQQRLGRSLKQRLDDSEAQCDAQRAALQNFEEHKGEVQVMSKNAAQQLAAAQAEAARLRAALHACENQMAAQEARISALHSNLHLLDSHKDDLRAAVADASGAAERAAGTTTTLEARVRALQAQIRERDNVVATLKEQVIDLQNQKTLVHEAMSDHIREAKAAAARTDAATSRERSLTTQLSAREEEVGALQEQMALVAKEMDAWRDNGKALAVEVEAARRARDADAGRLAVAANHARMHEEAAQALRAQLAKMGEKESSAADVAADSHRQLWHAEALLAAERDRVRLLENQLADATARCEGAMAELITAQAETRGARGEGADAGRRAAHADAHVKTLQGRVKVLEAQAESCVLLEAELRGSVQQLEAERHAAVGAAAKENSALSSAVRAARARLVVMEKQVSDRDQQLTALRAQLSRAHEVNSGAAVSSADAVKDLNAAQARADNASARTRLLQTQLHALQQENQGLQEAVGAKEDLRRHDAAKAAEAATELRALNTRTRSLQTAAKLTELQLQEKAKEVEDLRAALDMRQETSEVAVAIAATLGADKDAQATTLRQAEKRAGCLQRRLDLQQGQLQQARQDALDAGTAADAARRHAANLSGELQRETARAAAAVLRCSGLEAGLAAADAEVAEVRGLLSERETAAGAASAEASSHVRGLEAQVRGLQGRGQVLENRVKDVEGALAEAHDAASRMHKEHETAVAQVAEGTAAFERLTEQLEAARRAQAAATEVAAERDAELEALRAELAEVLRGYDEVAGTGAEIARSEKTLRAGLAALHSEVRSLTAALAERDAEAVVAEEVRQQAQQAVRDARHEAAAAQERCEVARRQLRAMHGQLRRQTAAAEVAVEDAEVARGVALEGDKRASEAEAVAEELAQALERVRQQQTAMQRACTRHDEAAGRAAEVALEARGAALEERLRTAEARRGAAGAAVVAEALQKEVRAMRAAHDAQAAAADTAAAAAAELRATALDQASEMRALSAAVYAAVARAEAAARDSSGVRAQLQRVQGELQEREEALREAQAALQQGSVERAVGRVDEMRAEASLERAGMNMDTLKKDLAAKSATIQDLRQAMSELEGKLKDEQRQHAATRAEVSIADAALTRKAATLRSAEAEAQHLKGQVFDAEALLRELTQAKLEEGGNDAADRRAQHMHEVAMQRMHAQVAQLKQNLAAAQDRNRELTDAVAGLEQTLESARQDAAQRSVAGASTAAAAQRTADDVQKLKRQIAAAQQELADSRREKDAAVGQVEASARERQRASEELSKAAKAMILAQKQIEGSKRKAAAHTTDLKIAREEIAELKVAAGRSQRDARQVAASGPHVRKLEAENAALRERLREAQAARGAEAEARQQADREAGHLEESAEESSVQLRHVQNELAETSRECGHLRLQVAQQTHSMREGEKRLERCREQLAASIGREERQLGKAKQTYARLKSAWAQAKGTAKAAGAISAATRELRPVEIVGLYEEQRVQADTELKRLAAENEVLLRQVRDLENRITLTTRELSSSGQSPTVELQAKVADLERTNTMLQAELQRREVGAGDSARVHARQLAEASTRGEALAEENASLLLELNSRPAHKDHAALRREVDVLRQRLAHAEVRRGGPGSDAAAAAAELEGSAAAAGAGGRLMTTRERIARDKQVARLGLQAMEGLSHSVLVEVLQDACVTLDCSNVMHMHAAVLRVLRAANTVTELEGMVERLCDCVFRDGAALVPSHLRRRDLDSLVPVLQAWQEQLHDAAHVDQAFGHLRAVLAMRARVTGGSAGLSLPQVVAQVQQLVEGEGRVQATHDAFASVEQELRTNPQGGLQQIVRHFQDLFGVASIEGCLPMMSKVYAEHRAGQTFLVALSDMLGTPRSSAACLDCIQGLIDSQHGQGLPSGQDTKPHNSAADETEAEETVSAACDVLGCSSMSGVIPAIRGLTTRLLKLDGLIPRYQRVLSKVYDMLEIATLDEVVPALERAMEACKHASE